MGCWRIAFVLLGLLLAAEPAAAKRLALVLGNSDYKAQSKLANPVNDATDIARRLEGLGFEVLLRTDAGRREMARAITEFRQRIEPEDDVVVFYAGHGMQVDGRNYLIPVDLEADSEEEVAFNAVEVDRLLRLLETAGSRTNVVILDACRNNPFERKTRGRSQGLAAVDAGRGTLIAYATAPGSVAADGDAGARNSPYTASLLAALDAPGLKVEEVFKQVARGVVEQTRDRQLPWISSNLIGDLVINTTVVVAPPGEAERQVELAFWDSVKGSADRTELEAYLAKYPEGAFAALARNRIEGLKSGVIPAVGTFPHGARPGDTVKDCRDCPELVIVPAGTLTMGSPESEAGREAAEGPQREIAIPGPLAFGRFEVTVAEYRAFVRESGHNDRTGCIVAQPAGLAEDSAGNWRRPGYEQTDRHPAVCVAIEDVEAYLAWLSKRTGKAYRLPSEAEWEYAARAGTATARPWGEDSAAACTHANVGDAALDEAWRAAGGGEAQPRHDCRDGQAAAAPAGSYAANAFGLHDMLGNVLEWVEDCWWDDLSAVPEDGGAVREHACQKRSIRGGSWLDGPDPVRSAARPWQVAYVRIAAIGFRVVRPAD